MCGHARPELAHGAMAEWKSARRRASAQAASSTEQQSTMVDEWKVQQAKKREKLRLQQARAVMRLKNERKKKEKEKEIAAQIGHEKRSSVESKSKLRTIFSEARRLKHIEDRAFLEEVRQRELEYMDPQFMDTLDSDSSVWSRSFSSLSSRQVSGMSRQGSESPALGPKRTLKDVARLLLTAVKKVSGGKTALQLFASMGAKRAGRRKEEEDERIREQERREREVHEAFLELERSVREKIDQKVEELAVEVTQGRLFAGQAVQQARMYAKNLRDEMKQEVQRTRKRYSLPVSEPPGTDAEEDASQPQHRLSDTDAELAALQDMTTVTEIMHKKLTEINRRKTIMSFSTPKEEDLDGGEPSVNVANALEEIEAQISQLKEQQREKEELIAKEEAQRRADEMLQGPPISPLETVESDDEEYGDFGLERSEEASERFSESSEEWNGAAVDNTTNEVAGARRGSRHSSGMGAWAKRNRHTAIAVPEPRVGAGRMRHSFVRAPPFRAASGAHLAERMREDAESSVSVDSDSQDDAEESLQAFAPEGSQCPREASEGAHVYNWDKKQPKLEKKKSPKQHRRGRQQQDLRRRSEQDVRDPEMTQSVETPGQSVGGSQAEEASSDWRKHWLQLMDDNLPPPDAGAKEDITIVCAERGGPLSDKPTWPPRVSSTDRPMVYTDAIRQQVPYVAAVIGPLRALEPIMVEREQRAMIIRPHTVQEGPSCNVNASLGKNPCDSDEDTEDEEESQSWPSRFIGRDVAALEAMAAAVVPLPPVVSQILKPARAFGTRLRCESRALEAREMTSETRLPESRLSERLEMQVCESSLARARSPAFAGSFAAAVVATSTWDVPTLGREVGSKSIVAAVAADCNSTLLPGCESLEKKGWPMPAKRSASPPSKLGASRPVPREVWTTPRTQSALADPLWRAKMVTVDDGPLPKPPQRPRGLRAQRPFRRSNLGMTA